MKLNSFWVRFLLAVAGAAILRRFYAIMTRKNVRGLNVLITGGASGIGRQLALRFARGKAVVILWDINEQGLIKVSEEIKKEGGDVHTYKVDLSSREEIYRIADAVKEDVGKVDVLVNNAGIVSGKNILEVSDKMAQLTLDVNTAAHFWTVKSFLPAMIKENKGHIITIASAAGMLGVPGLADYCASKFGAFGFDESIRVYLRKMGHTGVKTTCVCPYYINTGMFEGAKTRIPLLLPILDENYVADQIFNAYRENQAFLGLPNAVHYLSFLTRATLPTSIFDWLNDFIGVNASMDEFTGRKGEGH